MSPLPHLVPLLSDPTTPPDLAIDALEEYILSRRAKGDSLFQLSLALAELEASVGFVPASLTHHRLRHPPRRFLNKLAMSPTFHLLMIYPHSPLTSPLPRPPSSAICSLNLHPASKNREKISSNIAWVARLKLARRNLAEGARVHWVVRR